MAASRACLALPSPYLLTTARAAEWLSRQRSTACPARLARPLFPFESLAAAGASQTLQARISRSESLQRRAEGP